MNSIKTWLAAQGGWYHVVAAVIVFLTLAYNTVTPVHDLATSLWVIFPPMVKSVLAAIAGLWLLYTSSNHTNQLRMSKAATKAAQLETADMRMEVVRVKAQATQPMPKKV